MQERDIPERGLSSSFEHTPSPTNSSATASVEKDEAAPGDDDKRMQQELEENMRWAVGAQPRRCTPTQVLQVVFDVLAVAISVADVVTDVIVAVEFGLAGHWLWFGLVVAFIVVTCVLYAVVWPLAINDADDTAGACGCLKWYSKLAYPLRVLIALPMSPAIPVVHWATQKCATQSLRDDPTFQRIILAYGFPPETSGAARARREYPRGAREITEAAFETIIRRVGEGLGEHTFEHLLFYIETCFEALPQALIQILALTMIGGDASWAQVVSVALSLVSIGTKAYVLSVSPYISTYAFKIALCALDLLSAFYVFATLGPLIDDEEKGVFIADGFRPTAFALVWLAQALGLFVWLSVCYWLAVGRYLARLDECPSLRDCVILALHAAGLYVLLVPLGSVGLQAAKASWTIYLIYVAFEPRAIFLYAPYRVATEFLMAAPDAAALRRRTAALARLAVSKLPDSAMRYGYVDDDAEETHPARAYVKRLQRWGLFSPAGVQRLDVSRLAWTLTLQRFRRFTEEARVRHTGDGTASAMFEVVPLFFAYYVPATVMINVAYVPAHAAMHFGSLSPVAQLCFWGTCGAAAVALLLMPAVVWTHSRGVIANALLHYTVVPGVTLPTQSVVQMVVAYHLPPVRATLRKAACEIPTAAVPLDLLEHEVASFLRDQQLDSDPEIIERWHHRLRLHASGDPRFYVDHPRSESDAAALCADLSAAQVEAVHALIEEEATAEAEALHGPNGVLGRRGDRHDDDDLEMHDRRGWASRATAVTVTS